jgi:hypothetical protein
LKLSRSGGFGNPATARPIEFFLPALLRGAEKKPRGDSRRCGDSLTTPVWLRRHTRGGGFARPANFVAKPAQFVAFFFLLAAQAEGFQKRSGFEHARARAKSVSSVLGFGITELKMSLC